ncbi:hypothetical protein QRX60_22845 [Amycolatopsis mongoliensis]|uniref:Uncharacterized protein n=1 Tax=Amycolatopsis mongoliensis TaxID=715475 RepID=A0A9Y2JXM0_9PSEU|nr:hypothetical protein [Amycolatopsis sp. 4-36]WIY06545.1 hypothetical protein QRX60_22845 [Amycolatopsis sp. 4-36]
MTQGPGGQSPPSTTEAAKNEAREVATTAADRGGEVAQTPAQEAKHVAEHAQREARDLLREGRDQLETQARDGQRKAAQSLHQLAGQLDRMAEQTDSPGVAADVARQVSGRTRSVADWLEHREPGDLLDEVRRFARRRPGAFLVGAALAGAVVGRLTRGVVAQQQENSGSSPNGQAAGSPGQAALPHPGQATPPPHHPGPVGVPPVPPASETRRGEAGYPGGFTAPQPGDGGYPATTPGGYAAPQPSLPQPSHSAGSGPVPR